MAAVGISGHSLIPEPLLLLCKQLDCFTVFFRTCRPLMKKNGFEFAVYQRFGISKIRQTSPIRSARAKRLKNEITSATQGSTRFSKRRFAYVVHYHNKVEA